MKLEYFYDDQFGRVLKHLIRIFGEFQVQNGVDDDNNQKYRKVPCLYADISRQTQYQLAQQSENILNSAPFMTISIKSFNMNRAAVYSPTSLDTVVGENSKNEDGTFSKELKKIHHVQRFNPVPWTLEFDLNIWTTTLQSKMELIEQIGCIFNPAIQLQLSTNPLDWTSLSNVELTNTEFSTRAVPQGTDTDLDIAKMTFKTEVYLSMPAIAKRAVLIQQIVQNIQTVNEEQDIMFDHKDITSLVFTPKNFCISVDKVDSGTSTEMYEVTLLNEYGSETNDKGKIYNWKQYLDYLDPQYKEKTVSLKFQTAIENGSYIRGTVNSIGSGDTRNKLYVQVDNSGYTVEYTIKGFYGDDSDFVNAEEDEYYCYLGDKVLDIDGTKIKSNDIIMKTANTWKVYSLKDLNNIIYNEQDQLYYKLDPEFGWIRTILSKYRPGYWRISFSE